MQLTDHEQKLLLRALDKASASVEAEKAAEMLIASLRKRGISGFDILDGFNGRTGHPVRPTSSPPPRPQRRNWYAERRDWYAGGVPPTGHPKPEQPFREEPSAKIQLWHNPNAQFAFFCLAVIGVPLVLANPIAIVAIIPFVVGWLWFLHFGIRCGDF